LGHYPFLRRGLGESYTYGTWQVGPPVRDLVRRGAAEYLPLRYSDISRVFSSPDVVLIHTSMPAGDGSLSLGVSVGLAREFAMRARMVIAEASTAMPFTLGESTIPLERVDFLVPSESPCTVYRTAEIGPLERRIADHVCGLIPDGAFVETGIGTVPEALIALLAGRKDLRIHTGMVTDAIIPFAEGSDAPVVTGEVAGSPELFRFVNRNPQFELRPASHTHDVPTIARLPRFIAINSAIEVDLSGQVNAEAFDGAVASGVGGSLDFMEGAALSVGGKAVIAMPATADGGRRSRIVAALAPGTPVTIPRHCVHYVVTEHGVAELRGKSLNQRAQALIGVADPAFRESLEEACPPGGRSRWI
jgi:acyl-CoA hydrolase